MPYLPLLFALLMLLVAPAYAETFERVDDKDGFLSLVQDKQLKRFGIRLEATLRRRPAPPPLSSYLCLCA